MTLCVSTKCSRTHDHSVIIDAGNSRELDGKNPAVQVVRIDQVHQIVNRSVFIKKTGGARCRCCGTHAADYLVVYVDAVRKDIGTQIYRIPCTEKESVEYARYDGIANNLAFVVNGTAVQIVTATEVRQHLPNPCGTQLRAKSARSGYLSSIVDSIR